jgi:hypothetical protein
MRKITAIAVMFLFVLATAPGPAWAQSSGAHFQKKSVSAAIQSNGNLLVSWVEAGLGNLDVNYTLTGNADATYYCVTNSGNIPNANNKIKPNPGVETGGSFKPKNGSVTASLTLPAPPAPASAQPTCGGGQTLELQSITWSEVDLTDTSNNVLAEVSNGTFSITLFPAPK